MRKQATEQKALELKEASRRTFDGQAAVYDEEVCGSHARRLYPHVVKEVAAHSPRRVLDLGCGTGALAELVLKALPGCELAGVDLSDAMLARARERLGERARLLEGDSEHLPFPDGFFDAVYCNDSFHHFPDPERAAFEAWRVLRAGGVLVVGECWLPGLARAVMNAFMPYGGEGDVRIYSEAEMRGILGTWFDEVSWRKAGSHGCLVTARKAA
ncbi:class I SAM-dependent methyltransferase [Gordonibacter sp. 28C]|uniref:class I SAM-dependent methyltransferase n=1 Tax=Gordonibacter sp. 28C TaxID=2078569 RepID=UPI001F5415C4|nr:class I SAM-dependent methyltransferase [Gordonibacter sp. 28C]